MPTSMTSIPEPLITLVRDSVTATIEALGGGETSYHENPEAEGPCDGLCGIVAFIGDLSWSFMLALPRQTAVDLTRAFAGFDLEFDSADMTDAVGELANIVGGDLIARLEAQGTRATMSLPTVARGHDVQLFLPHDVPCERLTFASSAGEFWLKLAMAPAAPGSIRMPGQRVCAGPRNGA